MHSPVYVNYLCCSWRQSATCISPVMLCTSAWQKARWGGWADRRWRREEEADTWENRLPPLSEWSHHRRWMKTSLGVSGERCSPFQKTSWRRGEARRVADPSREGGIPLSETDRSPHSARRWQRLQPPRNSWETGCCRPSTATATWVY